MKKKVLIDELTLQERITQLAKEITKDYKGKELTLICILKGSVFFFTDLAKRIKLDTRLEFIRVSSYEGEKSTGKIKLKVNLDEPITNKDVIVIEDIIDTGKTLSYLMKYLSKQKPNSLKLCTLLDKPEGRQVDDIIVDYVGFTIPNRFVIGYGLDLDEQYRNLPAVYCFTEDSEKILNIDRKFIKGQIKKNT
jgi:hypoxanthine phosphoribosyltransferase